MCLTYEKQSNICGHVASHTELCLEKKNEGVLKIFCPKCIPTRNRTNYYELCHDCRRFWRKHGIGEKEAIEQTRVYRTENNYFGPVTPHSFGREKPYIMQDIDLTSGSGVRGMTPLPIERTDQVPGVDSNLKEWLVGEGGTIDTEKEVPKDHEKNLIEWLVNEAMGYQSSSAGEPSTPILMLWPRVPSAVSEEARRKDKGKGKETEGIIPKDGDASNDLNLLPHPDKFQVGGVETTQGFFVNPNEFELETLGPQVRANVEADGFETQELYGSSYRP